MLFAVLRSKTAVKISIQIIKAFVAMRKFITTNAQIFHRLDAVKQKQFEHKAEADVKGLGSRADPMPILVLKFYDKY
jgi:hypothetical protein